MAHSNDVNGVIFHPKNPLLLASCSDDGVIKLWKLTLENDSTAMEDVPTT